MRFVYFLCAFFLLPSFIVMGAESDLVLIDRIKNYYDANSSFSSAFEQNLIHKESGAKEKRTGQLSFQKPLRIRWQTSKPNAETLVVTDNEIWDYIPDEEIVYKYSPALIKDSGGIIQVITGQSALNRDFDVKNAGTENSLVKLLLYPHEPTTQLVEAVIWVEPEEGIIKRARIIDFYGNENDVSLKNFKKGGVKTDDFKFPAPENVEIEDRTKGTGPDKGFFQ